MPKLLLIGPATGEMVAALSGTFEVTRLNDLEDPEAWVNRHGAEIAYVGTNGHDGLKPTWMAAMPNLRLISCYGVGYDAIDAVHAAERGILVTHTPNVLNADVAGTAVLLMLACYRELLRDDAYVRSGRWAIEGSAALTRSPEKQRVGILGMGRIGQEIARKLKAFDAEISYHTRSEKDVPHQYFDSLVAMAEHVQCMIVITPGGAATRHLVNEDVINALGPTGTLINVARGSVVDEEALVLALENNRLGWAGLDVFEDEPNVPDRLRSLPNVALLPHAGSATVETRAAMAEVSLGYLLHHAKEGTVFSPVPVCVDLR